MDMSHFHVAIVSALLIVLSLSSQLDGLESTCVFGGEANCFISSSIMCRGERRVLKVHPNKDCNQLDCKCTGGSESKSPLQMKMTNKSVGSLSVSFSIVSDLIYKEETEVVLRVNNQLNETECYKNSNGFEDLMRKRFRMTKCNSTNSCDGATDTVIVNFANLHTGCYQVEVRHENRYIGEKSVVSCPKYFTTGHAHPINKYDFHQPKVVCQFLENGELNINIRPFINGSKDSNQFFTTIIDENNDTNYFTPNESNFKVLEDGILSYQYDTLRPGNYCHGIRYLDGRCLLSKSCDCVWRQRIMVFASKPRPVPIEDSIEDSSSTPLVIMTLFTLIGLFLALMVVCLVKRKSKSPQIILPTSEKAPDTKKAHYTKKTHNTEATRKIFLLYPRDCNEFMEAVRKLRQILKLNRFEVSDVWDSQLIEKIRPDPTGFVQSNVGAEDTTTIVVTSECSNELICVNSENSTVYYREPQEFDDLFRLGLKCLESFNRKRYIVRIVEPDQKFQLNGASEVGELRTLVDELSKFKLENPGYLLNELIFIEPKRNGGGSRIESSGEGKEMGVFVSEYIIC
ncbi:uncharacterized protein LOC111060775 isoform X2 [Nilaparvata lugens]|uniref:uncharacterized protein LOC111060775 isoform X2 n=1 Tax=Nilaparvata lugens TaxID=108931 RepID=UPI00193DF13B|nr:uncharacterized protein LOC111060775 isoform X2 [Nilaparvata lugens]